MPRIKYSESAASRVPQPLRQVRTGCYAAVAVGASTGGPDALRQFLTKLPATFPVPIIVAQHMPPVFTQSLAESLDQVCELLVKEAADGDCVERGHILIAPGGMQTRLEKTLDGIVARVNEDKGETPCRPSVDILFNSMAEVFGDRSLGIIMTGMGRDGNIGCRDICDAGAQLSLRTRIPVWSLACRPSRSRMAWPVPSFHSRKWRPGCNWLSASSRSYSPLFDARRTMRYRQFQ